jgi:hypothetical protein
MQQARSIARRAPVPARRSVVRRHAHSPAVQRCGSTPCACPSSGNDLLRSPAISSPGDPLEQEADRVADQVLRTAALPVRTAPGEADTILRQATGGSDALFPEEDLRRDQEEEEQALRGALQLKRIDGGAPRTDADVAGRLHRSVAGGQPLGQEARAYMEPRFGHSFADVRVHTDAQAASLCDDLSAQAFTYGRDVYFSARSFDPDGPAGRKLLAHELAHVVQQRSAMTQIHRACQDFPAHSDPGRYCETEAEAAALVTRACPPERADFLYNDGPEGFRWRPIPGYGCAHYVAHRLGITEGERHVNCLGGFSVTIGQITAGRNQFALAQARVDDIWSLGGIHSGVVIATEQDAAGQVTRVRVNQCNTQGNVNPIWTTDGTFWR